jgi:hypothetical protein
MTSAAQTPVWLRNSRYVGMLLLILTISVALHWLALSLLPFRLTAQEIEAESPRLHSAGASVVVWSPSDDSASRRRNNVMTVFDPTLIAFSGDRGFTHRVSRGMPPITYRAQPRHQRPRLTEITQFAQIRTPVVAAIPLPQELAQRWTKLSPPLQEFEGLLLPLPTEPPPAVAFRGALTDRPLLVVTPILELRNLPAKPIRFEIAVDKDGRVRSVMLKGDGSGNVETDQLVADALSRCVFAPTNVAPRPIGVESPAASQPHLEWGEAIVLGKAKPTSTKNPDSQ